MIRRKTKEGKAQWRVFNAKKSGGKLEALRDAMKFHSRKCQHDVPEAQARLGATGHRGVEKHLNYFAVKWKVGTSVKRVKTFSFAKEEESKALEKALEFRRELDSRTEKGENVESLFGGKPLTERGVRYCTKRKTWVAEYYKKCRYFPEKKFGKIKAEEMARFARRQAIANGVLPSYDEIQEKIQEMFGETSTV